MKRNVTMAMAANVRLRFLTSSLEMISLASHCMYVNEYTMGEVKFSPWNTMSAMELLMALSALFWTDVVGK